MIKYSILTYIFKEGDILREAPKDDNIEYICVTDNPDLKSDTWKIIVDEELKDKDPEYASFYVRYHPFKYCSGNICMRIDGSIQIHKSPLSILEEFDNSNKDVCVMTNSRARSIMMELFHWSFLPKEMKSKQISLYKEKGIDITKEGCIQSPISITRNTDICNSCDSLSWNMIEEISLDENHIARPTQVIMTVALHLTEDLDIMFVDESLIQSDVMQWCRHNSNTKRRSLLRLTHKEFFGTPIKIHEFNEVHYIYDKLWGKTKEGKPIDYIINIRKSYSS